MKIGIIVPEFPSYTETFFINQVKGLCSRGHRVFVFSNTIHPDKVLMSLYLLNGFQNLKLISFDFHKKPLTIALNILLHPFYFLKDIWHSPKQFRKSLFYNLCLFYFSKYDCDVYHFGYTGTALTYYPLFKKLKGKRIVSCRGTAENVKTITEEDRNEKLVNLFAQTDAIHCVSFNMQKKMTVLADNPAKLFVNQPAIDSAFFTRNIPYLQKETPIQILSMGRLVFQKGFIIGLLAIAKLHSIFKNFKWIIVGYGPEEEELNFNIHLLQLTDTVVLAGKKSQDEIKVLYNQADIFFLPSISEGIANVVLEAMSMELPVVSSDCGGMAEVLEHGKNGLICESYNYKSMAESLQHLCLCFEKRKALGVAARKTIESNFDLKRYIDVFEEHYLALLK